MRNTFTMILQIILICTISTLAQRQWTLQNSGTTAQLYDVDFIDEFIGFAVGNNVLLKTTDSGLNWVNWSSVTGTFYDLDFLDENLGFILRPAGFPGNSTSEIWKTTDGGQNWVVQTLGFQGLGISFADNLNGMIAAASKILQTTDGGETWIAQSVGNGSWFDVFFRNTTAIAVSGNHEIARTTDSGNTWDVVTPSGNLGDFQAVHWFDENFIFVTGDHGMVHSTDGGDNWIFNQLELDDIFGVYCVSATECTGVGLENIIIHTTDNGATWVFDNSGTNADFQGVYFVNSERGIAVGGGGKIVTTGPVPVPTFGTIVGTVSVGGSGFAAITVTLLDDQSIPIAGFDDQETDANGDYSFEDVSEGNYQVMIVEPLGYISDGNPKSTTVVASETSIVDFILTEVVVINQARSKGYWKHQFDVYVNNRGNAQESASDLQSYIDEIDFRYNEHFNIFATATDGTNDFEDWQVILSVKGNDGMEAKAIAQLAALLLNIMSLKIAQYELVTIDSKTAGDVLIYTSELIEDGDDTNDELAKDLAESVNNQQTIAAGIVPEGSITFKTGEGSDDIKITTYELYDSYPNPFNPATTIKYQTPNAGFVTLKIYDVLGNEVSTLVNERKEEGRYQIIFDASSLSSGVYIYQMRINDFIDTKKMILMK